MKQNHFKQSCFVAMMLLPLLILTACGSDNKEADVRVTITPGVPQTIKIDESVTFTTNADFSIDPSTPSGAGCGKSSATSVTCTPKEAGTHVLKVTASKGSSSAEVTIIVPKPVIFEPVVPTDTTVEVNHTLDIPVQIENSDFTVSVQLNEKSVDGVCVKASDVLVTCTPTETGIYTLTVTPTNDTTKAQVVEFTAVPETEIAVSNIVMRYAEPGKFEMGCTAGTYSDKWTPSNCTSASSLPAHEVTLTEGFYIGQTEVTQKQWLDVMGAMPPTAQLFPGDDNPVAHVTFSEVKEFIAKLNTQNEQPKGWRWALPTEVQWEYAARGGSKDTFCPETDGCRYSGSNDYNEVAWWGGNDIGNNAANKTHPVKLLKANELGLYDMSGNVREYVEDLWATNVEDGTVSRGGHYRTGFTSITVVSRGQTYPDTIDRSLGFRLALVPDPDYIPDAVATSTAKLTFFESASETISGVWDSITK
jgi:formylglycine-generating enzyme required for sulfatase activity